MLLASISATSGCACLPSRICPWDLEFRLNFFPPDAKNGFEFLGLFAIALCICTESSFWWTQTNAQVVGQMWAQLQAARPFTPSELLTDPKEPCYKTATSAYPSGTWSASQREQV